MDIRKAHGDHGGAKFSAIMANQAVTTAMRFQSIGGQPNTAKTTSGSGLVQFDIAQNGGSDNVAAVSEDGNVFGVSSQGMGCRFLVDEDGDIYSDNAAATFDAYDDAHLVRALDQTKGDVIRGKWDDYVQYNEQTLVDAKILGASVAEGGLVNVTQLQRLHNGAIWEGYVRQQEMQERIDTLETKLLALEAR
jgi:hypothetical protein